MTITSLTKIFERDLDRLKKEVEAYSDESQLWQKTAGINNSAGNLALHVVGNLCHYIGATLGQSGYVRDRDAEFQLQNVPRTEILQKINEALDAVKDTLEKLKNEDLKPDYPIDVFGHKMTTGYFLIHLTTHLSYHLGQINYHRRILTHEK